MNKKEFAKNLVVVIIGVYLVLLISIIQEVLLNNNGMLYYLPVLLGLGFFPSIVIKDKSIFKLITHKYILACGVLVFSSVVFMKIPLLDAIGMMIIVLSEEYSFRHCLISKNSSLYVVFISAITFAFILHNNEPIITNLLIRFPMGILLGYIYKKNNNFVIVNYIHYIYNIIQF